MPNKTWPTAAAALKFAAQKEICGLECLWEATQQVGQLFQREEQVTFLVMPKLTYEDVLAWSEDLLWHWRPLHDRGCDTVGPLK